MKTTIVGIDCATDPSKVGLALGEVEGGRPKLWEVAVANRGDSVAEVVSRGTRAIGGVLLALDAPLGWPQAMTDALPNHRAGEPIGMEANQLFRRHTDRVVKEQLGRTPLDVGADRIARTSLATLDLLRELRARTGFPIRLTWKHPIEQELAAIEVYPAATLEVRGMTSSGYKRKSDVNKRDDMLEPLAEHIDLPPDLEAMVGNADAFDAAICVLAGADFVRGFCDPPDDLEVAKKEGWIWFKRPEAQTKAAGEEQSETTQ
ncbi:MAG: DUF429 domain-containing protein [Deltaproteobacteria bacterium]|nr:DUF429 domain-containing protein [Deltaproteobacteria bacterium]